MTDQAHALSSGYRVRQLATFPPDQVRQIEAIYQVSFPPQERKPFWLVANAMQNGQYTVFVVSQDRGADSENVAFALLRRLRTSHAMYIEYLAVVPALRGQGIGSFLLRSMIAVLEKSEAAAIIWEVDPPEQAVDDKSRRIRFYERLGAYLIEQSTVYGMPNYWTGSGTVPLRLMWKPLHHNRAQPTIAELIAFIRDIYETEYTGHDAVRDEILAQLNRSCPRDVRRDEVGE